MKKNAWEQIMITMTPIFGARFILAKFYIRKSKYFFIFCFRLIYYQNRHVQQILYFDYSTKNCLINNRSIKCIRFRKTLIDYREKLTIRLFSPYNATCNFLNIIL